jgi:hypothetical protein
MVEWCYKAVGLKIWVESIRNRLYLEDMTTFRYGWNGNIRQFVAMDFCYVLLPDAVSQLSRLTFNLLVEDST